MVNVFDLDGVITIGIMPKEEDLIITGRSFEERPETEKYLETLGLKNKVYYNPLKFNEKTRKSSGRHKSFVLSALKKEGVAVKILFEDDPEQWKEVEKLCPWVSIVKITHDLTEKDNVRHYED